MRLQLNALHESVLDGATHRGNDAREFSLQGLEAGVHVVPGVANILQELRVRNNVQRLLQCQNEADGTRRNKGGHRGEGWPHEGGASHFLTSAGPSSP